MQLLAPAKINLWFRIRGRRGDGFHEIETLMVPVSVFDRISIKKTGGRNGPIQFTCNDKSVPSGPENLVMRAADSFRRAANVAEGIEIELEKAIPHGAGLGGGSSDAASTLIGLNELFEASLPRDELMKLAAKLGSDVPFFLAQSAAICRGRGEIVEPMRLPAPLRLLLVKPDFGVPTPWAYRKWENARELPGIDYAPQEFASIRFHNDLERPVFEKFVLLAHLKTWLRRQPEVAVALMSGSGSTLFALLRDGAESAPLETRAREELDPQLWIAACESVDR